MHCTLRYAQRAKRIKNSARVNVDAHSAALAQLRRQVAQLQQQLVQARAGSAMFSANGCDGGASAELNEAALARMHQWKAAASSGDSSSPANGARRHTHTQTHAHTHASVPCMRANPSPFLVCSPFLSLCVYVCVFAGAATDEALFQALQQIAALETRQKGLEDALAEASLRAARASDDCAELTSQLLDAEIERDLLRCVTGLRWRGATWLSRTWVVCVCVCVGDARCHVCVNEMNREKLRTNSDGQTPVDEEGVATAATKHIAEQYLRRIHELEAQVRTHARESAAAAVGTVQTMGSTCDTPAVEEGAQQQSTASDAVRAKLSGVSSQLAVKQVRCGMCRMRVCAPKCEHAHVSMFMDENVCAGTCAWLLMTFSVESTLTSGCGVCVWIWMWVWVWATNNTGDVVRLCV